MTVLNVKCIAETETCKLEKKIREIKTYLRAVNILLGNSKDSSVSKEEALKIVTSKGFTALVLDSVSDKVSYLKMELDLAETHLDALNSGVCEIFSNSIDHALEDVEVDLTEVCERLIEINKTIVSDPEKAEKEELRVERYHLERRVTHLTLAKTIIDEEPGDYS